MGNRNLPASVEPSKQLSPHSPQSRAAPDLPATPTRAIAELGACLTLVAPSGMSNDDRSEWLKVAHMTLGDIPDDLLARGCLHARRTCRFASEIVPSILTEIEKPLGWWQTAVRLAKSAQAPRLAPAPQVRDQEYVDPAEVRKLIQSIGNGAA